MIDLEIVWEQFIARQKYTNNGNPELHSGPENLKKSRP